MLLRLSSDDVTELHEALSDAYSNVIRELGRGVSLDPQPGLALCRRKWKLESLLRQLEHREDPPPVAKLVPATRPRVLDVLDRAAA